MIVVNETVWYKAPAVYTNQRHMHTQTVYGVPIKGCYAGGAEAKTLTGELLCQMSLCVIC